LLTGETPAPRELALLPTVLVVEDDPNVRFLVTSVLEGSGFTVDAASNGAEALSKMHTVTPDAIVLDLWMPVMNGLDFLRELRRTSPDRLIPVLAISARGTDVTARSLGVEAFLAKPFDLTALVGTVCDLIATPA
jgi:two-component system response regulator (stage 0 sporulation protein F)